MTDSEQSKYNKKVSKYFGTDLAKAISCSDITQIKTIESLIILLCEYISKRTNSVISSPGFGSTVYIYCNTTKKVIYTLNNYKLDDYQERVDLNGTTQFVSRFDNIVVAMSRQYKPIKVVDDIDTLKNIDTSKMSTLFG
jgi:hypothetical protein